MLFIKCLRIMLAKLTQALRMLLPPIAHVPLHSHWIIRRDLVSLNGTCVFGTPLKFGLSSLNQQRNNLRLILPFTHLTQDEITPGLELLSQATKVLGNISHCPIMANVEHIGP